MRSGENNFNHFPKNNLTKLATLVGYSLNVGLYANVLSGGLEAAPVTLSTPLSHDTWSLLAAKTSLLTDRTNI